MGDAAGTGGGVVEQSGGAVTLSRLAVGGIFGDGTGIGGHYELSGGMLTLTNGAGIGYFYVRPNALEAYVEVSGTGALLLPENWTASGNNDLSAGGFVQDALGGTSLLSGSWDGTYTTITAATVPEPSSFALVALGLAGLGWFGIGRRKG